MSSRKAELLEERKKKWSASRAVSELTDEVTKEVADTARDNQLQQASLHSSHGKSKSSNETDYFLHKLTDKLTEHIRGEMKRELQNLKSVDVRETMSEHMESFLEAELSTHTCKICFELMTSPVHTPILLFPCGHTFCQLCMDRHIGTSLNSSSNSNHKISSSGSNKTCPYCRMKIESRAINQSLKELIDQFSRQKALIQSGKAGDFDQIFPNRDSLGSSIKPTLQTVGSNRHHSGSSHATSTTAADETTRYMAQLKSCEMRHTILSSELEEVDQEEQQLQHRKTKIAHASQHLQAERIKIDTQLRLLQEERDLVDKHLAEQQRKQAELSSTEIGLRERAGMVRGTLQSLQGEMVKLRLLVEGTAQHSHTSSSISKTRPDKNS